MELLWGLSECKESNSHSVWYIVIAQKRLIIINIYFSEASAPWEITPLFLEVTRAYHSWDHKEVFSGMMWWSSASSISGWAFNPCWLVGDPSSSQLVVSSAGSEACHDSTVALGVVCCVNVTARLSCKAAPHSGVSVCWQHVGCLILQRFASRYRAFRL